MGGGCLPHIVAVEKLWMTNSGDYVSTTQLLYQSYSVIHSGVAVDGFIDRNKLSTLQPRNFPNM